MTSPRLESCSLAENIDQLIAATRNARKTQRCRRRALQRTPAPPRSCRICREPTVHAHYGVDACKACSIFFRRAVLRCPTLVCKQLERARSSALCSIVIGDGEMCFACRIDRCLLAGMDVFGVKLPAGYDFGELETLLNASIQRKQRREQMKHSETTTTSVIAQSNEESSTHFVYNSERNYLAKIDAPERAFFSENCHTTFLSLVAMPLSELYKQTELETLSLMQTTKNNLKEPKTSVINQ